MTRNHCFLLIEAIATFSASISIRLWGRGGTRNDGGESENLGTKGWKMMHRGEKWRCVNPECCAGVVVTDSSQSGAADKLRCGCGTVMRRLYEKPTARKVMLTADTSPGRAPGEEPLGG